MKNTHFLTSDRGITLLISLFYLVGMAGHLYPPALPLMISLTPWVLLIFGALTFGVIWRSSAGPLIGWAVAAYLATFMLEALGVATGAVFGSYRYGGSLGLMLFDVPLVIGFNWMIIVLGISGAVYGRVHRAVPGALLTGAGATLFDWVMEPAAISLDYWHWSGASIPLQNYAAWFLIATACALAYRWIGIRTESKAGIWYVGIQLLFFLVLRIGEAGPL